MGWRPAFSQRSLNITGGEHFAIVVEELCEICFMAPHLWFVCPSDLKDDIKFSQRNVFGCCYSLICLALWCLNLLIWQIAGRMWCFRVGFFTPKASNLDQWLSFTGLIWRSMAQERQNSSQCLDTFHLSYFDGKVYIWINGTNAHRLIDLTVQNIHLF